MSTYNTTFYFYYNNLQAAIDDLDIMKREITYSKSEIVYIREPDEFWTIKLHMPALTAKRIKIHDVALSLKFAHYDGWGIDTKDPYGLIDDLGYVVV